MFTHFGGLTNAVAQVVQLGATDLTTTGYFNFVDTRAVNWEHALNAFACDNAANGKGVVDLAMSTATRDNRAVKDLDALFVAFLDLGVDVDGIADFEISDRLGAKGRLEDFLEQIHDNLGLNLGKTE